MANATIGARGQYVCPGGAVGCLLVTRSSEVSQKEVNVDRTLTAEAKKQPKSSDFGSSAFECLWYLFVLHLWVPSSTLRLGAASGPAEFTASLPTNPGRITHETLETRGTSVRPKRCTTRGAFRPTFAPFVLRGSSHDGSLRRQRKKEHLARSTRRSTRPYEVDQMSMTMHDTYIYIYILYIYIIYI